MIQVKKGQVWRFTEPTGIVREFTVGSITQTPFGRLVARGKTRSGKIVTCCVQRLMKGTHGAELVQDVPAPSVAPKSSRTPS